MHCSCLNQLSGQDDWERACGKAGRNHAKKEVLGGAGDVACSLRNTRKAKLHSLGVPGSLECRMRHATSQPQKLAYRSIQRIFAHR
jgi:hypothetical protein